MVKGIGLDLVSVARVEGLVEAWGEEFLRRVFTGEERDYCLSRKREYEHLAGRFAAKESVIKAVGKKLPWRGIEVISGENGKPAVRLDPDVGRVGGGVEVHVSITHTSDYAGAIAVIEAE